MTTNLREQLDSALIRNGRVDIHVEFSHSTDEQIQMMWCSYYPNDIDKSLDFVQKLRASLGEKQVSASALQHFFVRTMMQTADQALGNVGYVLEDMKQKEVESKSKEAEESNEDSKQNKSETEEKNGETKWTNNINPLLLGSLVFLAVFAYLKK
jgi:chaperone BCS1